jgi:pre-60S factor REI1
MISANASAITELNYKCICCNKSFKSQSQLDEHKKSKKHKKNEKEYLLKHPDMDSSGIFKSYSQSETSNILEDMKSEKEEKLEVEEIKLDEHRPTALESNKICLFSDKQFDTVKECLDHMREKHSFYFLDVDCLVDLKGILKYMAERIQLGNLCLHCSK